jgi:hypothetical protein
VGGVNYDFQGLKTWIGMPAKSLSFRETIVKLWRIAVAANNPSIVDNTLPLFFAVAERNPQRTAIAKSPFRISPKVRTLRYSKAS